MGLVILNFLKKHWKWFALGIGVIALGIYLRNDFINDRALDSLLDNIRQTSEAHEKEIKRLEEINKEKEQQLEELNREYEEKIIKLKEKYEEKLSNVETKTVIIRKKIIEEAKRDPTTLTKRVEETFGIPFYKEGE